MRNLWMVMACGLAAWIGAGARAETLPWWDDYPLFLIDMSGSSSSVALAQAYNATASYNTAMPAPSWGTYWQKASFNQNHLSAFQQAGFKSINYNETFGNATSFVGELGPNNGDLNTLRHTHWDWQNYSGGTIVWVGPQNWFDDQEFARPYTRTHPVYGGPPMRYPDGTIATGYNGDASNPLNSRVFDAGFSKDILGRIYQSDGIEPTNGSHTGLIQISGVWTGHIGPGKDTACPMWADLAYASARMSADVGLDGMWTDNFDASDSFGWPAPIWSGFGEWSVALFRDYLSSRFTPSELSAMGIANVATFDVRTALRAQCVAWGGDDTNLSHPVWKDARWLDHPLWHAYVIFKRQKGTEALSNYYHAVKHAASDAGKSDFLVAGNGAPPISLGWPRGDLDMVNTECPMGYYPDSGSRGFMLPPVARYSPRYKLSREHARGRLVNVWLRWNTGGSGYEYRHNPELNKVMCYEMLATHTLPMPFPEWDEVAGTQQSYSSFYGFVKSAKATFGNRIPAEDIALYYSSSSLLAFMTPGGFLDFDNQPHQFAVYGWGTALAELHYQYRMVPEWKLNAATLSGLRALIIPNASVFDPDDVANVLLPWVQGGGLLIVTGDSGRRLGESGNFEQNPAGLSLAPLTGISSMTPPPTETLRTVGSGKVLYLPDNIGMTYYNESSNRAALLPAFQDAMGQILAGEDAPLISAAGVPSTIGLTLYRDEANERQFVDINNMNIDLPTDTVTPVSSLSFEAALLPSFDVPDLRVSALSPDGAVSVSITARTPGRATITTGAITHYASVIMDYPDADRDGLSDETETVLGTNPNNRDTDHDGLSDYAEVNYDGDLAYSPGADTNPLVEDSDGDGMNDGTEVTFGSDPLDPMSFVELPAVRAIGLCLLLLMMATAIQWRRVRAASPELPADRSRQ